MITIMSISLWMITIAAIFVFYFAITVELSSDRYISEFKSEISKYVNGKYKNIDVNVECTYSFNKLFSNKRQDYHILLSTNTKTRHSSFTVDYKTGSSFDHIFKLIDISVKPLTFVELPECDNITLEIIAERERLQQIENEKYGIGDKE